jgi:hypothetical protein
MQLWWEVTIIAAMFVLRLGVPVAVICLVSYLLRRLDARWQAEAAARRQQLALTCAEANLARGNAAIAPAVVSLIQEPCWEYRACPEAVRARCPAYLSPRLPCWIARGQSAGEVPGQCCNCPIFAGARRIRTGVAA